MQHSTQLHSCQVSVKPVHYAVLSHLRCTSAAIHCCTQALAATWWKPCFPLSHQPLVACKSILSWRGNTTVFLLCWTWCLLVMGSESACKTSALRCCTVHLLHLCHLTGMHVWSQMLWALYHHSCVPVLTIWITILSVCGSLYPIYLRVLYGSIVIVN